MKLRTMTSRLAALAAMALMAAPALAQDTAADARRHVERLASDELEGRGTGTDGAAAAAAYIIEQLQALGAEPLPGQHDFRLGFEFTADVRDGGTTLTAARHSWDEVESIQALSFSDDGEFSGEIVFAGYGITPPESADYPYDSYATLDVTDKIVLVLDGYPQDADDDARRVFANYDDVRFKAFLARSNGASGILIAPGPLSPGSRDARRPSAGMAASGSGILAASIGGSVAAALLEAVGRDLSTVQAELDTGNPHVAGFDLGLEARLHTSLVRERRPAYNVVGYLPATEPLAADAPWVMLGAHYDHLGYGGSSSLAGVREIHNGADDNASGVAAVLLAGARLKDRPRARNVALAFWSGEEIGLVGSTAFVNSGALATEEIAGYVNFDMVGRSRDNKLTIQGVGSSDGWRALIERSNIPVGFDLSLTEDPNLPTDSTAFNIAKVPAVQFFTGSHSEYHRPTDDADLINYEDLARVAQLGASLAYRLVSVDNPPAFVAYETETREVSRGGARVYTGTIPDYASDVKGLLLGGVMEGGPAEDAGLQGGDVIVKFGGQEITNIYDYTFALEAARIDEPLEVVYVRDGETFTTTLTPRARE